MAKTFTRSFMAEVLTALQQNRNNVTVTAAQFNISRNTLIKWRKQAEFERSWLMADINDSEQTEPSSLDSAQSESGPSLEPLPTERQVANLYIDVERAAVERLMAEVNGIPLKNMGDARQLMLIAAIARDKYLDITVGRRRGDTFVNQSKQTIEIVYTTPNDRSSEIVSDTLTISQSEVLSPGERGGHPEQLPARGGGVGPHTEPEKQKSPLADKESWDDWAESGQVLTAEEARAIWRRPAEPPLERG